MGNACYSANDSVNIRRLKHGRSIQLMVFDQLEQNGALEPITDREFFLNYDKWYESDTMDTPQLIDLEKFLSHYTRYIEYQNYYFALWQNIDVDKPINID